MRVQRFLLFASLFLLVACSGGKEEKGEQEEAASPVVDPPVPEADVPRKEYRVDASKDTTLTYEKTGSQVHIPAGSFVNAKGKKVEGKVKVTYREFHTPADMYAAGVPTTYSMGDGKEKVFCSYGMMELRASKDGKELSKAKDKEVRAEMTSIRKGNSDLYYLDEASGEWQKYGSDSLIRRSKEAERDSLPETPLPPTLTDGAEIEIRPGIEVKKPEGYKHSTHLFEPLDTSTCDPPSTADRITIAYGERPGTYRIKFSHPRLENTVVETCVCQPAYMNKGADFKQAMKRYRKKYKEELQRSERLREAFNERWSEYAEFRMRQFSVGGEGDSAEMQEAVMDEQVFASKKERLERSFEVQGFGYTNCDKLQNVPVVAELEPVFKDRAKQEKIELHDVAVAEIPSNSLMRMGQGRIRFDPSKKNLLWGLTKDGRLAYMKPDRLGSVGKKKGDYTFKMTVSSKKLNSYEQIKKVLF